MNLNGKIVTVFGGSGFIGRQVVRELADAGYTIRVVTRSPGDSRIVKPSGFVGQIVPVKGSLCQAEAFAELVKGSYAVVNLVGILFESGKQKFKTIHAEAPEKLAKAAKAAGVEKFVHISALFDEKSKSKYAESKLLGEKLVTAAFPEAVIFKPSVVFGADDNFFNKFAQMTSISPFLPLINADTKFQPVYVGDVALAVKKAVDENVKPGIYQLGGPEALSFRQIQKRVLEYTGRKRQLLEVPNCFAKLIAVFAPKSVITCDQLKLLQNDNVVTSRTKTLSELGITPVSIEAVVPKYLARFKKKVPSVTE